MKSTSNYEFDENQSKENDKSRRKKFLVYREDCYFA